MNRGQIIPKDRDIPHKKFLVRVYVGRDDTGKRKYHSRPSPVRSPRRSRSSTNSSAGSPPGPSCLPRR
jgi:hypothetical protein